MSLIFNILVSDSYIDYHLKRNSFPPLICAGFVYCHCTGKWAVLDNIHGKDSGAFR